MYLWQLKTPKTDSKGRPVEDERQGRVLYRRTPSFRIINKLKNVIPTEYWYEEATASEEDTASRQRRAARRPDIDGISRLLDPPTILSAGLCPPTSAIPSLLCIRPASPIPCPRSYLTSPF